MLVRGVACQSSAGAVQKKSTSGVPYPAGGVGHRAKMPACTTESSRMSAWPLTWSVAMWGSVPRPIPGDRVASAVAKRRNNFRALVAEGRPSAVGSSRNPERINAAVLQNPIGLNPDHPTVFPDGFNDWAEALKAAV